MLVIGGVFLGALIIGCISLPFWPQAYTATATIVVQPKDVHKLTPGKLTSHRFDSKRFLKTQETIIRSQGFLTKISSELGLPKRWNLSNRKTSAILKNCTHVSRDFNEREIQIRFSSPNAQLAVEIANAIGANYIEHWKNLHNDRYDEMIHSLASDHKQFKSAVAIKLAALDVLQADEASTEELEKTKLELAEMKKKNASFESEIEKVNLEKAAITSAVRFKENATVDDVEFGADISGGITLILLLAFFATAATAGFLRIQAKSEVSISDIAKAVAPPTLTLFPQSNRSISEMTGPFEKLREGIIGLYPAPEGVTIAAVPCLVEEDASAIACELAKTLSSGGNTTLIIDGNINEPRIHGNYNASPHPGVSDYLAGEMSMKETVVKTQHDNLWMMPGGTIRERSSDLMRGERMQELVVDAKSRFDFVIFNSAPILSCVDSLILIGESDMTFLCTEAGEASNDVLTRTRYAIEQAGGKLGGLVLTGVNPGEVKKGVDIETAVMVA